MFCVKDVMTTPVISVTDDNTIEEVVSQLLRHHVSGLTVVDRDGRLEGLISEYDLLRILYCCETKENRVSSYMTRDVQSVQENDSLIDVADIFLNRQIRRLPVVRDGKVVGIVSRRDLIRFIRDVRERMWHRFNHVHAPADHEHAAPVQGVGTATASADFVTEWVP